MISIINTDNSIRFTFKDSDHYLQNGTIDAPLNSIALVLDDSDMATFKKAVSGDLLFSIPLSELGMSKEQLMQFYKSSMVGDNTGGGGGGAQIKIEVVDKLPDVGKTDTIYLVKRPTGGYDEYIYVNGEWDLIGDTDISLDDYYTKAEADGKFGTLTEQQSLRSDVENALGEIAALGYDKQDNLEGNYISQLAQGGANNITYRSKTFNDKKNPDGQIQNIYLKTINGETIFGQGDIQIEGGGGTVDAYTKKESDDKFQDKLDGYYLNDAYGSGNNLAFGKIKFDKTDSTTSMIPLKTINGQNVIGDGDIELATTEQIDKKVGAEVQGTTLILA